MPGKIGFDFNGASQSFNVLAEYLFGKECYIWHVDGVPISSEPKQEGVEQCLEAAIQRQTSKGMELEL